MELENKKCHTTFRREKKGRKNRKTLKTKLILAMILFFVQTSIFAQLLCDTEPATTEGNLQNSNQLMDATIIGISIMIVIFTLVMSAKYLFKPCENNPEHIKNIVKDEGF